jgi:hypothetical protein
MIEAGWPGASDADFAPGAFDFSPIDPRLRVQRSRDLPELCEIPVHPPPYSRSPTHYPPSPAQAIFFPFNHLQIYLDTYGTDVLTWVVIVSRQLRCPAPGSSSPRLLCVRFPFLLCFLQRATFQRSDVPTFFDLSLFLSYSSELFCVHQKLNSLVFKQFRTLLQKHPGWGTPISIFEEQNETANC